VQDNNHFFHLKATQFYRFLILLIDDLKVINIILLLILDDKNKKLVIFMILKIIK